MNDITNQEEFHAAEHQALVTSITLAFLLTFLVLSTFLAIPYIVSGTNTEVLRCVGILSLAWMAWYWRKKEHLADLLRLEEAAIHLDLSKN